jgi:serralysin
MNLVKGLDQKIQVAGSVAFQNSTGGLSNYVYVSDLAFSNETFNEKLLNTATDDVFDGGVGLDSMVYQKSSDNYSLVRQNATTWQVTDKVGTDGKDTLRNIERIQFSNKSIAYDLDGNAGTTAKILGAVFGKSALSNQSYVGIGLYFLDQGMSYESLATLALGAANVTSNSQVLNLLWTNVVGSQPSNADLAPYIQLLDAGMSQGQLVRLAADSAFNANSIKLVGLSLSGLEFIPV